MRQQAQKPAAPAPNKRLRPHPPFDLFSTGDHTDLTRRLVYVGANVVPGWPALRR